MTKSFPFFVAIVLSEEATDNELPVPRWPALSEVKAALQRFVKKTHAERHEQADILFILGYHCDCPLTQIYLVLSAPYAFTTPETTFVISLVD